MSSRASDASEVRSLSPDDFRPVRTVEGLTRDAFEREVVPEGEPVLIKGLVSDWPVVARAAGDRRSWADYLRGLSEEKPLQTFFAAAETGGFFTYSDDLTGFNFERCEERLSQVLEALVSHEGKEGAPFFYAGAVNVPEHLPRFADDHPMPLLSDDIDQLVSVWLGNRTRLPAHWDLPENLACGVLGRRRFTLFPIEQVPNLYIGPLERTLAGQPSSLVDIYHPDLERFPRYADAIEHGQVALVEPGDVLYVPSLWLHHVESLEDIGMLVNFWWRGGNSEQYTPLLTLMHGLIAMRGMPARERRAWRVLFDHFLFEADEEKLAHLPENVRGVLGDLTPQGEDQVRRFLASRLVGRR